MDRDFQYKQLYEKRPDVQQRRLEKSAEKLAEHRAFKDINKRQPEYRKGQLDPELPGLLFSKDYCKKRLPPKCALGPQSS